MEAKNYNYNSPQKAIQKSILRSLFDVSLYRMHNNSRHQMMIIIILDSLDRVVNSGH